MVHFLSMSIPRLLTCGMAAQHRRASSSQQRGQEGRKAQFVDQIVGFQLYVFMYWFCHELAYSYIRLTFYYLSCRKHKLDTVYSDSKSLAATTSTLSWCWHRRHGMKCDKNANMELYLRSNTFHEKIQASSTNGLYGRVYMYKYC